MFEAKFTFGALAVREASRPFGTESPGGWFGGDLLAELQAINLKTVRWLRAQAQQQSVLAQRTAFLADNAAAWRALDERAIRDLAACPCALTDAEFANCALWESVAAAAVRDAGPPAYGEGSLAIGASAVLLGDAAGRQLARLTTQLGWHLARHRPIVATVTLGMSAGTAKLLLGMRLTIVDSLAEWLPALVKPRWHDEPRVWAQLLAAALRGAPLELESARVGALQLIARQLAKARDMEAVRAPPSGR